jgi:ubiquinol oxidase
VTPTSDSIEGPVTVALSGTRPFGPMVRLGPDELRAAQAETLATPRRRPSLSDRVLFAAMDLFYGSPRALEKFRVLELIARVPYQAWENVAYVAVTQTAREQLSPRGSSTGCGRRGSSRTMSSGTC